MLRVLRDSLSDMSVHHEPYPSFTLSERIADGAVHGFGVALAIVGAVLLLVFSAGPADGAMIAALAVYAGALIATFVASASYHMTPWEPARPWLRRLDHAAIYVKIAGTYTPLVILIGTGFAYLILTAVWVLAIIGAGTKLFFWRKPSPMGAILYLILGWLSLALIWPMSQSLPLPAMILIGAGGLLYSFGVIFFGREGLRFANAIWHVFVLAGSACFFAAIGLSTATALA